MKLERALRGFPGAFVLISVFLARYHSPWWLLFTALVGFNLFQSAFTNWCPMKSLMCFYSPAGSDYLLQAQVSYKFSDNLAAALGANIFGGADDWTSMGQFEKNDNAYLSVRFDF